MSEMERFLLAIAAAKFKEAVNLQDVESCNDPENEPYKSKYKAREIFHELKIEVEKQASDNGGGLDWLVLTAVLDLKLGLNYVGSEEVATGENHFIQCIDALTEHRLDHKCCVTLLSSLNQLGILWADRRAPDKAFTYLQKAEALYTDYVHDVGNSPMIPDGLFEVKEQDRDEGEMVQKCSDYFEDKHTHTLYYLAQVYGTLEETEKSAQYCHETLRRQLDTRRYDASDWSLNAATLSQFYLTRNNFAQARHCLASASHILQEIGDPPETLTVVPITDETQEELSSREKLPKLWTDIYRCWIKYGLMLLEHSQACMYEKLEREWNAEPEDHNYDKKTPQDSSAAAAAAGGGDTNEEPKCDVLRFNLELTAIESQITDEIVMDFESAREVFLAIQKWIKSTKEFYVLDGYCTDHVELVQDHSKGYKLLAGFERDLERQSKMHKRRVDMLLAILKEISQQHYLLVCRQLIYEVAETYSNMLDIKLALIEESETPPTPHAKSKINQLTTQSIEQYQTYLNTLKDTNKELPSKYAEDDERPVLVAHFCMGRLYSKYLDFEVTQHLANIKKSIDYYKYVVDYCKRNPESAEKMKSERELCEEMVYLLPSKMDRIRAQSQCQY